MFLGVTSWLFAMATIPLAEAISSLKLAREEGEGL